MEILKANRYFEFYVFHGVPEIPVTSFGKDVYSDHGERENGKPICTAASINTAELEVLGYFMYDIETKKEKFIYKDEAIQESVIN